MADHAKKPLPERLADALEEPRDFPPLASLLRNENANDVAVALDKLDDDQGDSAVHPGDRPHAGVDLHAQQRRQPPPRRLAPILARDDRRHPQMLRQCNLPDAVFDRAQHAAGLEDESSVITARLKPNGRLTLIRVRQP